MLDFLYCNTCSLKDVEMIDGPGTLLQWSRIIGPIIFIFWARNSLSDAEIQQDTEMIMTSPGLRAVQPKKSDKLLCGVEVEVNRYAVGQGTKVRQDWFSSNILTQACFAEE